jgi:hypothetical protein
MKFFDQFDVQVKDSGFRLVVDDAPSNPVDLPEVIMPGGSQTISLSAAELGQLLARTNTVFNRGGAIVSIAGSGSGAPVVEPIRPAAMPSKFESVARLMRHGGRQNQDTGRLIPTICSESSSRVLMASDPFRSALPSLSIIACCPVLVCDDTGGIREVCGYDEATGIYAQGTPAVDVPLDRAVSLVKGVFADFRFASKGDEARALANLITPALICGQLITDRAPIDLGEADDSQSGKGYRNRVTAALYGDSVQTVTQRKGGVGSLEESFNRRLMQGANFVALDNIRGAIDSPAIESFLTEDTYHARVPYADAVIDPRRTIVQLTSNRADITKDLANRSSCVRIQKQPLGYKFRSYPEGDLLAHVRANQPLYLGAVFAIVRAWWDSGRLRTSESRHDFRGWAQVLDWICQNILGTCPIMDGHRDAQLRITTPALNWLRDISLVVKRTHQTDQWLRTNDIIRLVQDEPNVDLPGLRSEADIEDESVHRSVLQACGRRLKKCFEKDDRIIIDGIEIQKRVVKVERPGGYGGLNDTPEYLFTPVNAPIPPLIDTDATPAEMHTRSKAPDVYGDQTDVVSKATNGQTMESFSVVSVASASASYDRMKQLATSGGPGGDAPAAAGVARPPAAGGVSS